MLVAFDINQTRDFQLKDHKGEDEPVFVIGVLDSGLDAHLQDSGVTYTRPKDGTIEPAQVIMHTALKFREVVRFGLKSIRNFKDASRKPVELQKKEFSTPVGIRTGLTDESLNYVLPWIPELAEEILRDNTITEEEQKN